MEPIIFTCKRGASFKRILRRINPETGLIEPIPPGMPVVSKVGANGKLWTMTVAVIDGANGLISIEALSPLTRTWDASRIAGDVGYGTAADQQFSETYYIDIEQAVSL